MPLLDHFHAPLKGHRHWESFHGRWAAAMADTLNQDLLPPDYFAEFHVHVGGPVQVDVATFEKGMNDPGPGSEGGTATLAPRVWSPPAPALVMPALFPDDIEVQVFSTEAGPTLVAAVELVSPGNKDREEARRAFASKCASYLQQGIGLVLVDIVTSRQANLHDELVQLLRQADAVAFPGSASVYAVAYRPARREMADVIDIWPATLAVGQHLPTMPLALRGSVSVPLDLESTYMEARRRSRLA